MKVYDHIPEDLIVWARQQKIFWVASAPLDGEGHINLSPKGTLGTTFQIVGKNKVWYEDLTGSGIETLSHIRENGRITILFHAFTGPPRILRLHGRGVAHEFGTPEYEKYITPEMRSPGSRSVIVVDVHRVTTSCGYGIPFFDFVGERTALAKFASNKESKGQMQDYWKGTNLKSIDGLPGLQTSPNLDMPPLQTRDMGKLEVGVERRDKRATRDAAAALAGFTTGIFITAMIFRFSLEARRFAVALA